MEEMLGSGGDDEGGLDGGEGNGGTGVSSQENLPRETSPIQREQGLITQMEEEVETAGLGGWFNDNPEGVPESWSGCNSDTSSPY